MNISGVSLSSVISQLSPTTANTAAGIGSSGSGGFGSIVKDAVESLDQSQKNSAEEIAKAVTGESPDLHRTIIAMQTADLGFQFALQVRNKVIGAYEEIMRMQV
ncbi:MAG: flagellar hook-basal body complex protein FliE [Blastocatellia bacterium]|jgi:flagellar hook-basal body complex protein FliE|nr:flagellar hook-basal body complex protein FliE [Blastocatellia bacterium]